MKTINRGNRREALLCRKKLGAIGNREIINTLDVTSPLYFNPRMLMYPVLASFKPGGLTSGGNIPDSTVPTA